MATIVDERIRAACDAPVCPNLNFAASGSDDLRIRREIAFKFVFQLFFPRLPNWTLLMLVCSVRARRTSSVRSPRRKSSSSYAWPRKASCSHNLHRREIAFGLILTDTRATESTVISSRKPTLLPTPLVVQSVLLERGLSFNEQFLNFSILPAPFCCFWYEGKSCLRNRVDSSAPDEPTASSLRNVYARSPTATHGEPMLSRTGATRSEN